jgi:nicotinamide riboside kinase
MKRIAIFGTHGAAKTTLVYKLAAFFKMKDKNVTVIHETARQSPFPINLNAVYQTTLFVVSSQLQKELSAEAQGFEIAISDRTLSDAFIYINHLKRGNELTKALEDFSFKWLKKYDVLIYLEPTEGFEISQDGIRATDKSFQQSIRDQFRDLVKKIEDEYGKKVNIIKAESNNVFDENECNSLLKEINRSLYEQVDQCVYLG